MLQIRSANISTDNPSNSLLWPPKPNGSPGNGVTVKPRARSVEPASRSSRSRPSESRVRSVSPHSGSVLSAAQSMGHVKAKADRASTPAALTPVPAPVDASGRRRVFYSASVSNICDTSLTGTPIATTPVPSPITSSSRRSSANLSVPSLPTGQLKVDDSVVKHRSSARRPGSKAVQFLVHPSVQGAVVVAQFAR